MQQRLRWLIHLVRMLGHGVRRNCRLKPLLLLSLLLFIILLLLHIFLRESLEYKDLRQFSYPPDVDLDVIIERAQLKLEPIYPPLPDLRPSNPRTSPFVLGDLSLCQREKVELLLAVKTTHAAEAKRAAIRSAWGQPACFGDVRARVVFLLGHTGHSWQAQALRQEQAKFGDILKQPFRDSYYNNTLKMMMGFEYFVRHCSGAKFLVLLDDDYLVNPRALITYVRHVHRRLLPRFLAGHVWYNAVPKRDPRSKWYMSPERYPFINFPPYAEAGTLIVSSAFAQDLYTAMQYTKYHPFDDVFLGFVLHKLHIAPVHCQEVYHTRPKRLKKNFISCHGFDKAEELIRAWKEEGLSLKCARDEARARRIKR